MWRWCPQAASAERPHPSGTCPLQRGRPRLRSYPGLHPLPLGCPGWPSNRRTHWGPGGGTGGQGTTADLWGQRGVTAHSLAGPRVPTAPPTKDVACVAPGHSPEEHRQKWDVLKPSKGVPADGHKGALQQASPESPGPLGASLQALGKEAGSKGPTQRPLARGLQETVWRGPGLTALSEKILDLCDGGMGFHLGEAQAKRKSALGESGPLTQAPSC